MKSSGSTASIGSEQDQSEKRQSSLDIPSHDRALADVSGLIRADKLKLAEEMCVDLAEASPHDPRILHKLGEIAYRRLDYARAVAVLTRVVALDPENAAYHARLGTALARAGRHEDAIVAFRRATELKPQFDQAFDADLWGRLGESLKFQGHLGDAAAAQRRAIDIAPNVAKHHRTLGLILMRQRKYVRATEALRRAVELEPNDVQVRCHLANACVGQSRSAEAIEQYSRALELAPDSAAARFGLCMAQLPIIYDDEAAVDARRAAYRRQLQALRGHFAEKPDHVLAEAANAVALSQPFFLAYQGRVDRELQALYGELVCKAMAAAYPRWSEPLPMPKPGENGRIRVGIVSGFFHWHSNWKIPIKGWAENLDRKQFELFGYYTQSRRDSATARAAAVFDRFARGPRTFSGWCETVRRDDPNVLIFPEIGMDPMTAKLAALRLAPVQCSSWGHPNTSGYPTIDYFLSSDLMEPADGDEHYTETLVRLPNLSIHYTPPPVVEATITRAELGVRENAVLYWCCQSLFKYVPRFDDIFPRIAQRVGDCQFVFLRHASNWVTETFRSRLERAFAAQGMSWERYCVLSERLSPARFAGAMRIADVFLDSIGWSGCNTTLEACAVGLPVVTCRGETMRGRHTAAMMEMMGLSECVADTVDDYVDRAARMGMNSAWRAEVAAKVGSRRHAMCNDPACIEGLEAFLLRAVAERTR